MDSSFGTFLAAFASLVLSAWVSASVLIIIFVVLCLCKLSTNYGSHRLNMVYKNKKRPYGEDESCNVSFKHPRQLDYTSLAGSVLCNNSLEKPHKSGNKRFLSSYDSD